MHALNRLAAAFGYSASGLAKQAGLDATSFNKSKRHSSRNQGYCGEIYCEINGGAK